MEKPEKIVEMWLRHIRGWTTLAGIGCGGGHDIELLAIDLATRRRFHVESGLSGRHGHADLTVGPADYAEPAWRAERTIGHFVNERFEAPATLDMLGLLGFAPDGYQKVIVAFGWTPEAAAAAREAGIELWDFRQIVSDMSARIKQDKGAFDTELVGAIAWFCTFPDRTAPDHRPDEVIIQSRAFWHFERWTFALIEPADRGVTLWVLDDSGRVLDELPFATKQEAEEKLERNDFRPYDPDDPGVAPWVVAPRPPFWRPAEPVKFFSSGTWK